MGSISNWSKENKTQRIIIVVMILICVVVGSMAAVVLGSRVTEMDTFSFLQLLLLQLLEPFIFDEIDMSILILVGVLLVIDGFAKYCPLTLPLRAEIKNIINGALILWITYKAMLILIAYISVLMNFL